MPFQPPSGLKAALHAGETKFGMWVNSSSVQVAEISALAGFDFLVADLEHGHFVDVASAAEIVRAGAIAQVPVIVRVPGLQADTIGAVLDQGALGICVPHIRNAEEAAQAVAYARYAPDGVRAMSPFVRAAGYSYEAWDTYWREANDEVLVIALIEDLVGVENVDEIAGVPGIDVIWVGPGDLSQDAGVPFQLDHPIVAEAVAKGLAGAKRHGRIAMMTTAQSPTIDEEARSAQLRDFVEQGYRMITWPDMTTYAAAASELLRVARDAAMPRPAGRAAG
jgi:4-hydroxy-2-oxoheptanedioate aldolase